MFRNIFGRKRSANRGEKIPKLIMPMEPTLFSAICYSFEQAVELLGAPTDLSYLTLAEISDIERDSAEAEASLKFSDCLVSNTSFTSLCLQDSELTVDLVQAVKKAVTNTKSIDTFSFQNLTCTTPEAGKLLRDALLDREEDYMLILDVARGDGILFQTLLEATAKTGTIIDFNDVNLTGFNVSRCLTRWTLQSTKLTRVEFIDIEGFSLLDELRLMKGFRNFVNLKTLALTNVLSNPDSSITLCESLACFLHPSTRFDLSINQQEVGISELGLRNITKLVETFSIRSLRLRGVRTSFGKRLISSKILFDPDTYVLSLGALNFSDEKDFQLMHFGLKQRKIGPAMHISPEAVTVEQQVELAALEVSGNIVYR